ncbi:MAG: acyltransferase family protein [Novosphingobium sp.]
MIAPARFLGDLEQPGLVAAIDCARWLAAAVVVIGHARFALLKGYDLLTPAERPLWVKGWYFVTGYFVEAVLVFFVLSGFLVGGMVCARLARGGFDPGGYAIDRFSRLYTAFLPALLLTVLLTWIGAQWFGATGLYDGSHPTFAEKGTVIDYLANAGLGTFAGNAAMLQFYFVEPYGSNPPLWTLSSEFWFYAVFGLAATARLRSGAVRPMLGVLALAAALALGPMFVFYLAMWLLGVAAAVLRPPKWPLAAPALVTLALVLVLRRYSDGALEPSEAVRLAIQAAVCLATAAVLLGWRAHPPRWALHGARFHHRMADFSYSLYLTHFPVMTLLVAALGAVSANPGFVSGFAPTNPVALATYAADVALAFGFAWLFAQATERRTGLVRGWLKRRRRVRAAPLATPGTSAPTTAAE